MTKKKGKTFNTRTLTTKKEGKIAQPNQWVYNEQQIAWLGYYMDPRETETYGNPYQAAIKAGYSETYARNIMNPSVALQWVQTAKNIMRTMNTEHIRSLLEDIATNKFEKASDRIAAAKLLGMEQGMFVNKTLVGHIGIEEALEGLE